MTADVLDISEFRLVENLDYSPNTGIKIDYTLQESYQAQSTFRFTDGTASKDASLKNLIVSSGTKDGESPTYKEHELSPTFDKDIKEYEVTLLEYLDEINITAIKNDENATMKIKYPKRDEEKNLVYEEDNTTLVYEEKKLLDNIEYTVILNELGKDDTNITIEITAEDGKTLEEYKIKIKRPYGLIKGSIFLKPLKSTGIYNGTVRIYKTSEVSETIDWTTVETDKRDNIHEKLLTLDSINQNTNDDGTYEIYVVPGEYDILLDKEGYLDHIILAKTINSGETLDLGEKELLAGDINKDGIIQLLDLSAILAIYESTQTDDTYNEIIDFNKDGRIQLVDLSILLANYEINREIEK